MVKELSFKQKKILSYFVSYILCGLLICLIGISNVFALVINSSFMGTSIGNEFNITSGSYKSANTSITVDESNALNYLVVDICSTMHGSYSISNISNQSGNVSFYKGYYISGTCALANYNGAHIRLYYKVNSWADAGNGNYGLIFSSRFNNNASYPGYVKVNSIYTLDTLDPTVANIEQSDKLNSSIQNSTDTITGSITDSENNINQNIDDMESAIVDSNKETQDVIKDQFETCRDSYNLLDVPSVWSFNRNTNTPTNIPAGTYYITTGEVIKGGTEAPVIIFNNQIVELSSNMKQIITFDTDITSYKYYSNGYSWVNSEGITSTVNNLMISKNGGKYEPYGEEICTNRIDETNNKLDDVNNTSKGIWETIKNLPNMFLDMLLGLFIPKDLSFINEFKDVISNKLGFIASVPIQIIDFALGLADVAFNEITTISFPSVEIFGVHFWNAEEIDITILLEKLKPFKYFTDFTCVILCCRTLYDMYHNFTGGGAD